MNNEIFLSHLESINQPIESVRKLRDSLNQLRELGFIDDAVFSHIKRDEKLIRDLPLLASESYSILTGLKPIYMVGLSAAFFVGIPTLALTNSALISGVLSAGVFYAAFKMRCKWMRDRIEVLTERRKFKSEIQKIAVGIKFIDTLEINYRKGVIKQGVYKILKTSEVISAGEVLLLVDDLESAFLYNEEIGFLREQAFDEIYVPEEYRTPEGETLTELDFLTVGVTTESVKNEADSIQAHFEQLIDRPFKHRDVDEVLLSKTIHETLKDRDNPLVDKPIENAVDKETISIAKRNESTAQDTDGNTDNNVSAAKTTSAVAATATLIAAIASDIPITDSVSDDNSVNVDSPEPHQVMTDDESSDANDSLSVLDALSLGESDDDNQSLSELLHSTDDKPEIENDASESEHEALLSVTEPAAIDHFDFETQEEATTDDVTNEINDFDTALDDGALELGFDIDSLDMPDISLPDDNSNTMSTSELDDLLDGLEEL